MENYLEHHGILGQKWGVRRYQNEDGTLTNAGRKRVSKEYKTLMTKTQKSINPDRVYIDAYNKTSNYMNSGGTDKYNKSQEKKYGQDYTNRDGYIDDYQKLVNKMTTKTYNSMMHEKITSDKNYQKAQELVKEYDMTSWDDLAKENWIVVEDYKKNS